MNTEKTFVHCSHSETTKYLIASLGKHLFRVFYFGDAEIAFHSSALEVCHKPSRQDFALEHKTFDRRVIVIAINQFYSACSQNRY